jgi:hypothetical protein
MSESVMEIDKHGNKVWKNINGKYHRTDGPAVEWSNGDKVWYVNGKPHRTDGPAAERPNGTKEWWANGQRHRTAGPAIEYSNGDKVWYMNGKFLGENDSGFWALWDSLSNEDRANPTLLSYLPGGFSV